MGDLDKTRLRPSESDFLEPGEEDPFYLAWRVHNRVQLLTVVLTQPSLKVGRPVMDAATREAVQGDSGWLVVAGASGNASGPCEEDSAIVHHKFVGATLEPKLNNRACQRHLGHKLLCLSGGARSEF